MARIIAKKKRLSMIEMGAIIGNVVLLAGAALVMATI